MYRGKTASIGFSALLLATLGGCAATRTYEVAVRNESAGPITVGMLKDGGKYEPQWASPEQAVVRTASENEQGWPSVVVPPGKTGYTGPVKGNFSGGAAAELRAYAGELQLSDVLAISRGSPRRVDVPLQPGRNAIIIRDKDGRLAYERVPVPQKK
jgi:hypothetical protein